MQLIPGTLKEKQNSEADEYINIVSELKRGKYAQLCQQFKIAEATDPKSPTDRVANACLPALKKPAYGTEPDHGGTTFYPLGRSIIGYKGDTIRALRYDLKVGIEFEANIAIIYGKCGADALRAIKSIEACGWSRDFGMSIV